MSDWLRDPMNFVAHEPRRSAPSDWTDEMRWADAVERSRHRAALVGIEQVRWPVHLLTRPSPDFIRAFLELEPVPALQTVPELIAMDRLFRAEMERGAQAPAIPVPRDTGRPKWTHDLFWQRYREAVAAAAPRTTQDAIADEFLNLSGERGIDVTQLRRLRRQFEQAR